MKLRLAILTALILLHSSILAQDTQFSEGQLSPEGRQAYQKLLTNAEFDNGYENAYKPISELIIAYRILVGQPHSDRAFKSLLEKGTTAAQLYGLCGLFETDYDFFGIAINKYKNSHESVSFRVMESNLRDSRLISMPVQKIVFLDKPNTLRLTGPRDFIEDWFKRANLGSSEFTVDISGGGYSYLFRARNVYPRM